VDLNRTNNRCQTLLHYPGRLGCEEILRRLLGREGAELNSVNDRCLTPLAGVVWCRYFGTVKTRLGRLGVDLNLGDRDGLSLLSLVGEAGCGDVLRMLLGTGRANGDPNPIEGMDKHRLLWLLQVGRAG